MKLTTLDAVVEALKGMRDRITVDESVRRRAKKALEMMLQV